MMKGFVDRFDHDIRVKAESEAKNADISVHANLNRRNASWIGGSMLASMSTFKDITLTQTAYQDTAEGEKMSAILKHSVY